jgi:hypothetical protein
MYFRSKGKAEGYEPKDWEIEQALSVLKTVETDILKNHFSPKKEADKLGTRTNPVTQDVLRTIEYGDGSFKPYDVPTIQTTDGFQEVYQPGTTRGLTNAVTSAPALGYASRLDDMGGGGATIGQYGQTNAPSPQQTPMPSPAPAPSPMPQANQPVRVISPDGKSGIIPATQVDQALRQGFRLAI